MNGDELTQAINVLLTVRGRTFTPAAQSGDRFDVMASINGSIEGHPVRFDFYGPSVVAERVHVVWVFDPRTKNQIAEGASPSGFLDALERIDWGNLLGALTH